MSHRTRLCAALLPVLAGTPALAANTASILATSIDTNVTTYSGGAPYQLQLNNSGGTSFTFKTTKANETVILTMEVSCYAIAGAYFAQFNGQTVVDTAGEPDFGGYGCNAQPNTSGVTSTTSWNSVFTVKSPGTHTVSARINSDPSAGFVVYAVIASVSH